MPPLVVGLSHQSAPIDLLEKVRTPPERVASALADLAQLPGVEETVLLSTCNRLEIYAVSEKFHLGYEPIKNYLMSTSPPDAARDITDFSYSFYANDAVRHLFAVTAGLRSAVLGEKEIQGQVKGAWQTAEAAGVSGENLSPIFSYALGVGRRLRVDAHLGGDHPSVPHVAARMAAVELGGLGRRRIVVLGSGEMGRGLLKLLPAPPDAALVLACRRPERAQELASFGGLRVVEIDELSTELIKADVLFTTTGAATPILDAEALVKVMEDRAGRSLLIVDLAVPRDVDPAAAELDGLTLWDMDDIGLFAGRSAADHSESLSAAESLLDAEVVKYQERAAARSLTPLIDEFRRRICDISQNEFERFASRLETLDSEQRETVESLVHGIVNKVLHEPTVRLRGAACEEHGEEKLASALRELFAL